MPATQRTGWIRLMMGSICGQMDIRQRCSKYLLIFRTRSKECLTYMKSCISANKNGVNVMGLLYVQNGI